LHRLLLFYRAVVGHLKMLVWWSVRKPTARGQTDHLSKARDLLEAIDRGGTPSNPAIINEIARGFGLEVSARAPVEHTIERIRQAVKRAS